MIVIDLLCRPLQPMMNQACPPYRTAPPPTQNALPARTLDCRHMSWQTSESFERQDCAKTIPSTALDETPSLVACLMQCRKWPPSLLKKSAEPHHAFGFFCCGEPLSTSIAVWPKRVDVEVFGRLINPLSERLDALKWPVLFFVIAPSPAAPSVRFSEPPPTPHLVFVYACLCSALKNDTETVLNTAQQEAVSRYKNMTGIG